MYNQRAFCNVLKTKILRYCEEFLNYFIILFILFGVLRQHSQRFISIRSLYFLTKMHIKKKTFSVVIQYFLLKNKI